MSRPTNPETPPPPSPEVIWDEGAPWRFGRGWSESALRSYLADLGRRDVNFDVPPTAMTRENGWIIDGIDAEIATESEGPPLVDGPFVRARQALINYDFSDPSIVTAHFDPAVPLAGRNMLLEIRVLGLRFLCGVRVHSVRDEQENGASLFAFRYDTLQGHMERGFEWFLLTKDHLTGGVHFRIEAHWQMGNFPSWWSQLGFRLIGERYRERWRRRAPERLRRLTRQQVTAPIALMGRLAHQGDERPQRTGPVE